jgi:hypothetical protein
MHKYEASRQLRKALTSLNGGIPRDALVLAMTYLGIGSDEPSRIRVGDQRTPFDPPEPLNSMQWKRHFAYPKENVHVCAARKIIDIKGGLTGVRCVVLAKSNSM